MVPKISFFMMVKETMPDPCLLNPCLNTVVTSFSVRHSEGSEKSKEPRAVSTAH